MKNIYLLLLVFMTTATLYAQNVTIPDANFKAYLVGNASINTNGDAEIQVSEASAFSGELYCYSLGISDLTGIEAFVNITKLWCYNNNLTSLDLSTNTALIELLCANSLMTNINLTQNINLETLSIGGVFQMIDLSNNMNLKTLIAIGVPLRSLDLTNNIALEKLQIGYNGFGTVDVSNNVNLTYFESFGNESLVYQDLSNNPALEIVDIRGNKLVWLNLANGNNSSITAMVTLDNPNLTCIQVDTVAYSIANWSGVDPTTSFSTNCGACIINIPDANLKTALLANMGINTNGDTEIQCEEAVNYAGSINVSSMNITDMTGIDAFSQITGLDCSNNMIDTLVITAKPYLISVDVSNNSNLSYLDCRENGLTSLIFNNTSTLETIISYSNNLSNIDLSTQTNLKILSLSNNNISTLDLSQNTKLETFFIDNNNLTNLDLSQDTSLISVYAYRNNLNSLNLKNLSTTKLTTLNVTQNPNLTCIDVTDVAAATATWTNIDTQSYFSSTPCFNSTTDLPLVQPIKVYPNPTTGNVNIDLGQKYNNATITLHNVMGQMISNKSYENRRNINFEIEAPKGIYFVNIVSDTGKQTTVKVIKE